MRHTRCGTLVTRVGRVIRRADCISEKVCRDRRREVHLSDEELRSWLDVCLVSRCFRGCRWSIGTGDTTGSLQAQTQGECNVCCEDCVRWSGQVVHSLPSWPDGFSQCTANEDSCPA